MIEAIIPFLRECWAHRRNRFVAVGGLFVLFITLTLASVSISWMPDYITRALVFLTGTFVLGTIALMLYCVAKFVFTGSAFLAKQFVHREADDRPKGNSLRK
jgi:hypothetical protein